MKLTSTQLRRIIKEEVAKAVVSEGPAEEFYSRKSLKLERILSLVDSIGKLVDELETMEGSSPVGNVEELRSVKEDVTKLEESVSALIDSVEAML